MRVATAAIAASALLLASAAAAQTSRIGDPADLADRTTEGYLYLDAPNTFPAPAGRMRVVQDGRGRAAALTPNQYYQYARAYKMALARLSFRIPVARAVPHARMAAFDAMLAANPKFNTPSFKFGGFLDTRIILPGI